MNRFIQTCFSLRDDQIVKRGGLYSTVGIVAGAAFLALAVLIIVRFGLRPESIEYRITQISDKLIQHANSSSSEPGTVVLTRDTIFLRKMHSFITTVPFIAGLFLVSIGLLCMQCGLLFQTLKRRIEESPTTDYTFSTEGAPSIEK